MNTQLVKIETNPPAAPAITTCTTGVMSPPLLESLRNLAFSPHAAMPRIQASVLDPHAALNMKNAAPQMQSPAHRKSQRGGCFI